MRNTISKLREEFNPVSPESIDDLLHVALRYANKQTMIKLFQCVFGVVYVRLRDVATVTRGGNFQKKDFVS